MLKYLIIQLDDSSTSFCHYSNDRKSPHLIPLDILKKGIIWAMKENLTLQFLYPDYEIPSEYKKEISNTFHGSIVSATCEDKELIEGANVVVFNSLTTISFFPFNKKQSYILRTSLTELIESAQLLNSILSEVNRINIVITDSLSFKKEDEDIYAEYLESLSNNILKEYRNEHHIQINILTDRILLEGMNNCNAGYETITLCPDGNFYVCPAFYFDDEVLFSIGSPETGLHVSNPQLYEISHAPICRICDAFQCRRCIWQNRKTTLEINTPSHEQCVVSHIERDASRKLLSSIRKLGIYLTTKEIPKIEYIDPFDLLIKNEKV